MNAFSHKIFLPNLSQNATISSRKEKMKNKKYSAFQIASFVLIAIFVVAIIVQIPIMVHLKRKTDDTKKKNDEITRDDENTQSEGFENIKITKDRVLIEL